MMLPWDEMLRAALSAGLRGVDFWGLSLREWRWVARSGAGEITPEDLTRLMEKFPDKGQ